MAEPTNQQLDVQIKELKKLFEQFYIMLHDESARNSDQDADIVEIRRDISQLHKNVERLRVRIDELQDHLDNGWRQEFIDMVKQQTYQMMKDITQMQAEQSRQQYKIMVEELKKTYDSLLEMKKMEKKRKIIDRNKLLQLFFGAGGAMYGIIEFVKFVVRKIFGQQ